MPTMKPPRSFLPTAIISTDRYLRLLPPFFPKTSFHHWHLHFLLASPTGTVTSNPSGDYWGWPVPIWLYSRSCSVKIIWSLTNSQLKTTALTQKKKKFSDWDWQNIAYRLFLYLLRGWTDFNVKWFKSHNDGQGNVLAGMQVHGHLHLHIKCKANLEHTEPSQKQKDGISWQIQISVSLSTFLIETLSCSFSIIYVTVGTERPYGPQHLNI